MNRIDMIGFIKVRFSNPNGDIDRENKPRQDDDGYGYITDVCIKRAIRDAISQYEENKPGYECYIENNAVLETRANEQIEKISKEDIDPIQAKKAIVKALCDKYFDIRYFGSVITTASKAGVFDGQIRGPVQVSMAESLEPIAPEQLTISRVCVTTEKDAKNKLHELGKKWVVPFGIYQFSVRISVNDAEKTGFNENDVEVLINAIKNMYENNHSSSKNNIEVCNLFVFEHSSKLGDCPFSKLEDSLSFERVPQEIGKDKISITCKQSDIPKSVKVKEL